MSSAGERPAGLPRQWQLAFERDTQGLPRGNDPGPERRAGRLLAAYIVTGLAMLLLPGTLLGVWNLLSIAEHRAATAARVAWIQAHGQAQLFGWVGTFILGISLYILPKFLGRIPGRFALSWTTWALWSLGVFWRWWAGVGARHWRVGLVASGILELAAFALSQYLLWFDRGVSAAKTAKSGIPRDLASRLGLVGFLSLGVALILNLLIAFGLAWRADSPAYPAAADRTFLVIALWAFAIPIAWGYSTRFVTIFLGLEPPRQNAANWLSAGVFLLVLCALAKQFFAADLLAVLLSIAAIWALRVFRPSVRPPKRVGVYRHFDAFVRLSYAWLLAGAALGVAADLLPAQAGLGGASRHALTVGFLATLILSIGPRILPAFLNGRELWSPRWMAAHLWLITLGCLLRVTSEAAAYSSVGLAWRILPLSALLELTAVLLFVGNMAFTLSQPLPAWFAPGSITPELPLYFFITSFPKTRRLLASAGLKTLQRVREVPRTLTLAEAAAADGVEMESLLAPLQEFFARRQPRRVGREASAH